MVDRAKRRGNYEQSCKYTKYYYYNFFRLPPGKGPPVSVKLFRFLQSENKLYDAVREPRCSYFVFFFYFQFVLPYKKKNENGLFYTFEKSDARAANDLGRGRLCR